MAWIQSFLLFVACVQNMGWKSGEENWKHGRANEVLSTERIMYFQDCPLDEEHILGVYKDVGN